jgi:hypothetical protein
MHTQLTIERQKNWIIQLENQNHSLEADVIAWKTRCATTQSVLKHYLIFA